MKKTLLPCPFCGAKADPEQGFHGLVVIGCSGDCFVNPQTQPFDKYDEAVAAWNKRTDNEDAEKWRALMKSFSRPDLMRNDVAPVWDSRNIGQ